MIVFIQARAAPAASSRPAPRTTGGAGRAATNGSGGMGAAAQAQIEDLNNQMMEMKLTVEGLEKERDFYFGNVSCTVHGLIKTECHFRKITGRGSNVPRVRGSGQRGRQKGKYQFMEIPIFTLFYKFQKVNVHSDASMRGSRISSFTT